MIAQLCLLRGISSWELGSTQPIPSFLKIIYMQHFFLIIIYNTSTYIYLLSYLPPLLNFIVFFYRMLNFIVIISRVSLHAKIYVKDVDAINVSSLLFFFWWEMLVHYLVHYNLISNTILNKLNKTIIIRTVIVRPYSIYICVHNSKPYNLTIFFHISVCEIEDSTCCGWNLSSYVRW